MRPLKFVLKPSELSAHAAPTTQISIWTFCLSVFDHSAFAFLQASPGQKHGRVHSPQHLREESRRSQLVYGENQSETLQCTKYK